MVLAQIQNEVALYLLLSKGKAKAKEVKASLHVFPVAKEATMREIAPKLFKTFHYKYSRAKARDTTKDLATAKEKAQVKMVITPLATKDTVVKATGINLPCLTLTHGIPNGTTIHGTNGQIRNLQPWIWP